MSTATVPQAIVRLSYTGIHEIDDMRWLFQGTTPSGWSFVGLRQSIYSSRHLKTCTHEIPPILAYRGVSRKHWNDFVKLLPDPLMNAMLPLPKSAKRGTGVYYLDTAKCPNYLDVLACLERMSSPVHCASRSWWASRPANLAQELTYTNLHPLIVHGITESDIIDVRKFATAAHSSPRTLILVGSNLIFDSSVTVLDTGLSRKCLTGLISLPFEHIGSNVVTNYCRYNDIDHQIID